MKKRRKRLKNIKRSGLQTPKVRSRAFGPEEVIVYVEPCRFCFFVKLYVREVRHVVQTSPFPREYFSRLFPSLLFCFVHFSISTGHRLWCHRRIRRRSGLPRSAAYRVSCSTNSVIVVSLSDFDKLELSRVFSVDLSREVLALLHCG